MTTTTRSEIESRIRELDTLIFTPRDAARERTRLRQQLGDLDRAARRKAALALARAKDPEYDAKLAAAREAETTAAAELARSQAARVERGRRDLESVEQRDARLGPNWRSDKKTAADGFHKAVATNVATGIEAVPFGAAWMPDPTLEDQLVAFQHSKARAWRRWLERWPFRLLEGQEFEADRQAGVDAHARRLMARGLPDPRVVDADADAEPPRRGIRQRLRGDSAA